MLAVAWGRWAGLHWDGTNVRVGTFNGPLLPCLTDMLFWDCATVDGWLHFKHDWYHACAAGGSCNVFMPVHCMFYTGLHSLVQQAMLVTFYA